MADYTDQVGRVLNEELRGNLKLVGDWVKYPHSQSVSPARNTMILD